MKKKIYRILKNFEKIFNTFMGLMYTFQYKLMSCLGIKDQFFNQKYNKLWCISYFSEKQFKKIKKELTESAIQRINNKKKIKVGFVTYTGSMWSVDPLYNKLLCDELINVDIIIGKFRVATQESREETYKNTIDYFVNNLKYNIKTMNDCDINEYDILFYLVPFKLYEKKLHMQNIYMKTLLCYTSYSYMLANKPEKIEVPAYYCTWKYFCDSQFYVNFINSFARFKLDNLVFCGFCKMDEAYCNDVCKMENKKVIIYAPHHSVNYKESKTATFEDNYLFMQKIAEKYSEETYWIIKPHPLLRTHSVEAGIFKTEVEYDQYMSKWNKMKNAEVIDNGGYIDAFKMSDAMITDSVSFLAEYQFTHNPLLLLESGNMTYNDFGNSIKDVLYKCSGDNEREIELFLNKVINEDDDMFAIREKFFDENLNYYKKNGKLAADYMYSDIRGIIR